MNRGVAPRYRRLESPENLDRLRRVFHAMNRGMLLLWRLGLGRFAGVWPAGFGRLLVIEHLGRRSGRVYRTPVNYTTDGSDLYCVAAFGGMTDWYRNACATPEIAVWLPNGRWHAVAEDASTDPRRNALIRAVLIDSGLAAPLFGLHPRVMSDAELARVASGYRLLRIRPVSRAPLGSGPGDLAWSWVVAAAIAVLVRRARRKPTIR